MGLFEIINIIFIVAGVVITIIALIAKSRENRPTTATWRERVSGGLEYEAAIRKMEEYIKEMDKGFEEFNATATSAITELDEKHQELLFLYSMVDEKKKEVADIYSAPRKPAENTPAPAAKPKSKSNRVDDKAKSSHPRRKDILNLSKQGLSVAEIAEELNVGQDMVKLILELGKAR